MQAMKDVSIPLFVEAALRYNLANQNKKRQRPEN